MQLLHHLLQDLHLPWQVPVFGSNFVLQTAYRQPLPLPDARRLYLKTPGKYSRSPCLSIPAPVSVLRLQPQPGQLPDFLLPHRKETVPHPAAQSRTPYVPETRKSRFPCRPVRHIFSVLYPAPPEVRPPARQSPRTRRPRQNHYIF